MMFGLKSEGSVGCGRGKSIPGRGWAKALRQGGIDERQGDPRTEKESVKRAEKGHTGMLGIWITTLEGMRKFKEVVDCWLDQFAVLKRAAR